MKIDFQQNQVSTTEEILDIHLEWNPSNNDEEARAAIIATFLDMIKKLNRYEEALNEPE